MTTQELVERLRAHIHKQIMHPDVRGDLRITAKRLSEMEAENKRLREALTTIGHSLVCAPNDYAEHNATELLLAGIIARAALEPKP